MGKGGGSSKLKAQGKDQAQSRFQNQDARHLRHTELHGRDYGRDLFVPIQLKREVRPQRHDEHRERRGVESPLRSHQSVSRCVLANSFSSLCSSCLCGSFASAQLNSYGLGATMQLERGLQAAETCVMDGAGEFPDAPFPLHSNGEWRYACGWFGAAAAGGRFCGLKAALPPPSPHNFDLGNKSAWPAHRSSLGPWSLVLPLSFELYPLSFPIRVHPSPSVVKFPLPP